MRGQKTGGRVAGTPNKKTAEIADRLVALGCDPIEGMARLAMDESNSPELRGRMFAELAQYVAPKRRAMEVKADEAAPLVVTVRRLVDTGEPTQRRLLEAVAEPATIGPTPDLWTSQRTPFAGLPRQEVVPPATEPPPAPAPPTAPAQPVERAETWWRNRPPGGFRMPRPTHSREFSLYG